MSTTSRTLLLLLFTIFCFTPPSQCLSISTPLLAKAISFFDFFRHKIVDDHAVSPASTDQDKFYRVNFFNDDLESQPREVWPAVDEKDVVVLTQMNFSDFIARNKYVMVNFYAPWCFWSQKLAPEYAAAATILKDQAVLAKIDCTEESQLAMMHQINGYPTMYLFVGGVQKVLYDFTMERTRNAIATWVKQKMEPGVQNVTRAEEAERMLAAKSLIVLGFLDTLEGPNRAELDAASKLHIDVNFYQTTNADVARLFHIDPLVKRPALIMLKREGLNHTHHGFDGQFTKSAIVDFVSEIKLPSVISFTTENSADIFHNSMKQLWLFDPKDSQDVMCTFQEAANAFKGKLFFVHVKTCCEDGRQLARQFGIPLGAPKVVAYMVNGGTKSIYDGELTLSGIKSFAEDFLKDKLLRQSDLITKTVLRLPSHSHASDPAMVPHAY